VKLKVSVDALTDGATPRRLTESLKVAQRARYLEKFKAAKVTSGSLQ